MRSLPYLPILCCTLSACVESVLLASECPPDLVGPCTFELDAGVDASGDRPSAMEVFDAGVVAPEDAAPILPSLPSDAGPPPVFPRIANPSFEFARDSGTAGDVVALSLAPADISPWYTCQPIGGTVSNAVTAVRAETFVAAGSSERMPKVDVRPRDGRTFISIGYFVNILPMPLLQELPVSLRKGERYAFAIDVLTTSPEAQLSVQIRGNDQGCLGPTSQSTLFTSTPVTSLTWTTVCVGFVTPRQLTYLVVAAEPAPGSNLDPSSLILEGTIIDGPRLYFDDLRPATPEECPGL